MLYKRVRCPDCLGAQAVSEFLKGSANMKFNYDCHCHGTGYTYRPVCCGTCSYGRDDDFAELIRCVKRETVFDRDMACEDWEAKK